MTPRLTISALFMLAAIAAVPCSAQTMRPGLWEVSNKMQGTSPQMSQMMAQMQKQMESMPPEQRKAVEEMMAKQAGGMAMPTMRDGSMIMKMCMTKEMIERSQLPMQQQGDCTNKHNKASANTIKMSFSCTNPPSSGEGEIRMNGDTGYTMTMKATSSATGKKESTVIDATGKWLGADCGSVKPLSMPPAKP